MAKIDIDTLTPTKKKQLPSEILMSDNELDRGQCRLLWEYLFWGNN